MCDIICGYYSELNIANVDAALSIMIAKNVAKTINLFTGLYISYVVCMVVYYECTFSLSLGSIEQDKKT